MGEIISGALALAAEYLPVVLFAAFVLAGLALWLSIPQPKPRMLNCEPLDPERIAARARELGWEFSKPHRVGPGYVLTGKLSNGSPWRLEYGYTASPLAMKSVTYRLEWMTDSVRAARTETMIAGRKIFGRHTGRPMRAVMRMTAAIGGALNKGDKEAGPSVKWVGELADFVSKARDLGLGSPRFRERFVVAAPPGVTPRLRLDGELERLICDWPAVAGAPLDADQRFAAWLEAIGLRIELDIKDPPLPVIEHLARVGAALAARIR